MDVEIGGHDVAMGAELAAEESEAVGLLDLGGDGFGAGLASR